MQLDVPTLMLANAFVATVSGALLFFTWFQYRETRAALWWAGANAALACGIVLIAAGMANGLDAVFLAGLTMLVVSSALTWAGVRSFNEMAVEPVSIGVGAAIWLMLQALPLSQIVSTSIHAAILVGYYAAAAIGIRSRDSNPLRARLPLAILIGAQAATQLFAIPATLDMSLVPGQAPPVASWFGLIHFQTLIFTIGTALFMVAAMKERSERRLVDETVSDPLTGLLNRRGFLRNAAQILDRARRDGGNAAVVVFDLDRFKSINDRHGHAVGDRVLQLFAVTCRTVMRSGDAIGRIGGEEFAVVLPGFGPGAGLAMAERVRKAFALAALSVDGKTVNATVCGGVAVAGGDLFDLDTLLIDADQALYSAKERGRNRIEPVRTAATALQRPSLIRVA